MVEKDFFAELAEKNAVMFMKVAEIEVEGNEELLKKYEENRNYVLDQYRIIEFKPITQGNTTGIRIYRVGWPICETRTEALQWLQNLIENMEKEGLRVRITAMPETQKVYHDEYPYEAEKRLIEKYYRKDPGRINRDLVYLEYGIKLKNKYW